MDFLTKIKNCSNCDLRQKTKNDFKKKHPEVPTNENIFYAFYYDKNNLSQAKFIFLMQNPGMPKNFHKKDEFKELIKCNNQEFVQISQKGLRQWLKKDNKIFTQGFLNILKSNNLIKYDNLTTYLDNGFLNDFIVTDLIKCRSTTEMLDKVKSCYGKCYQSYLQEEFRKIAQGKLIFCFSSRTWDTLMNNLEIQPLSNLKNFKKNKVAQVHGYLFCNKQFDCYLIPLVHFSRTQFNNYLRDSYFKYLQEGIKEYIHSLRNR